MATFRMKPEGQDGNPTITKRAMRRIIAIKDEHILSLRKTIKLQEEARQHEVSKLERERKMYLVLSMVSTVFGILGYVM